MARSSIKITIDELREKMIKYATSHADAGEYDLDEYDPNDPDSNEYLWLVYYHFLFIQIIK